MWNRFSDGKFPKNGERYVTFLGDIMIREENEQGVWTACVGHNSSRGFPTSNLQNDTWWVYEDESLNTK